MERTAGNGVGGFGAIKALGVALAAALLVLLGVLALPDESNAQDTPPEPPPDFLVNEGVPPPGANVACKPSEEHPYPVVLVHGTFERMAQNWKSVSPFLKNEGYCVFAIDYGTNGLGRIPRSARELDVFVERLLRYTGAERVQVVGHSQGGMMPRYWIKNLGGRSKVEDLVGFAPSNYGTNLGRATRQNSTAKDWRVEEAEPTDNPCYSCDQQAAGSRFIKRLNAGDDTPGGGSFTQIATEDDEIIIPFRNCYLRGTARTRDVLLQNFYRKYYTDTPVTHQNIYEDPVAVQFMLDALDNPGTVDPDRALRDFPSPDNPPPPLPVPGP